MSLAGIFDARPPFVRFEEREHGFDDAASKAAGRPIPRVITFACITPHGSKDVVEKIAVEWLEQIKMKALRGEFAVQWLDMFTRQFEEWKKGNELPRDGTPVQTWPAVNKEQQVRLRALGYTVIEDLAQVPDTSLGTIGMDGRYLRDLARNWLNESKDKGVNARQLADAQVAIEQLRTENSDLRAKLGAVENLLESRAAPTDETPRRGPGRPRKEEHTA